MNDRRPPGADDDVLFIEGDGEDVARVLEEAERAVEAVEERHRQEGAGAARAEERTDRTNRITELVLQLEEERQRAVSAEEEAGRLREALLRKAADFDNLKRRTEREKTDFFKFALAEVMRDVLGVLDNFERAERHAGEANAGDEYRAGIAMIRKQLAEILRKYGLTEIAAEGQLFDPNVHEAITREETDAVPAGTVLEVLQKGFALNDRLLRPARVRVAAAPSGPAPPAGGDPGR